MLLVTLDGWDWAFAGLYEDAKQRNDAELQQKIVKDYLGYHDAQFAFFEQLSQKIVGYEPKQILLLHASNLEADHIGELIERSEKTRLSIHHAGGGAGRSGIQLARHLCWGRRHGMA